MSTNALTGALWALLVLVFIAQFSLRLPRERHKLLSALVIVILSGAAIQYLGISELNGRLAAFAVASFIFFGSYLVYRLVTWLRRARQQERIVRTRRGKDGRSADG